VAVKRAQYLRACGACCCVVFEAARPYVLSARLGRWIPVDRRAPGTTPPPDPVVAGVRIAPKPVEVWPPVVPLHRGRDPGGNAAGSVAIAPMLLRVWALPWADVGVIYAVWLFWFRCQSCSIVPSSPNLCRVMVASIRDRSLLPRRPSTLRPPAAPLS